MKSHLRWSKASGSTRRLAEKILRGGRWPRRAKRMEGQNYGFKQHCGRTNG